MQARKRKTTLGGGLLRMQFELTGQSWGSQSQEYKFGWRTHHPGCHISMHKGRTHHPGCHRACITGGYIIPAAIKPR